MSIKRLSNDELEISFKKCVANERKILHWVLEHIREIDSRKLFAERGYDSMWSYLVKVHGYSKTAAEQRLYAARLVKSVPEASQQIQSGELKLSQLCQVSMAIKQKERESMEKVPLQEKAQILSMVAGKTNAETQKIISQVFDIPLKPQERVLTQKDESVHIQVTLTKEQHELLMKCKTLGFQQLLLQEDHTISGIIEMLCKQFLKKSLRVAGDAGSTRTESMNGSNTSITPKTRRFIIQRDQCCQFVDKQTGLICESKVGLQVDHIIPRWAGGDNSENNLRALCGTHNRLEYRKQASVRLS